MISKIEILRTLLNKNIFIEYQSELRSILIANKYTVNSAAKPFFLKEIGTDVFKVLEISSKNKRALYLSISHIKYIEIYED